MSAADGEGERFVRCRGGETPCRRRAMDNGYCVPHGYLAPDPVKGSEPRRALASGGRVDLDRVDLDRVNGSLTWW